MYITIIADNHHGDNDLSSHSLLLHIDNMTCMSCVHNIESEMSAKDGILTVKVDLDSKTGEQPITSLSDGVLAAIE